MFSNKINLFKFLCLLACLYPLLLSFYLPITHDDFQLIYSKGANFITYGHILNFSDLFIKSINLTKGWYMVYERLMGTYHFVTTFLFSTILDDFITYKVTGLLSHIMCLFLFAVFLKQLTLTSSLIILYVMALVPVFFQYPMKMPDAFSTYFTAHILFFQIILLSFILYARSLNSHTKYVKTLYFLSILLFIAAVNFYEVAFILSPAYILLSLHANNGWKKTVKLSFPYFIISILAILAWFLAKIIFANETNTYPITNIRFDLQTIKSFYYQFISAFPFVNLVAYIKLYPGNILNLIYWYDQVFFLALGSTSFFLFNFLGRNKILISIKQITLTSSLFIFIWTACALSIALSQHSISFGNPYPFAAIQMYMFVGLLFLLALALPSKIYINKFIRFALTLAIVACAAGNTISNKIVIYSKTDTFYLNNNYEYALKNGLLQSIADRQSTIIMQNSLSAWNPVAYFFHYSGKIVEVYQSWEDFLKNNNKDNGISIPYNVGLRDTNYNVVAKNNIIEFKPRDNIYYLTVDKKGKVTYFMLSRINKVNLVDENKPIFYTDKVYIFEVSGKKISRNLLNFKNAVNIFELKKFG